jgi:hypothetical protein
MGAEHGVRLQFSEPGMPAYPGRAYREVPCGPTPEVRSELPPNRTLTIGRGLNPTGSRVTGF